MKTLFIFLITILSSCNPNRNVLFVTFENGENIFVGAPVFMNGIDIGNVESIEFDDKYLIKLKLRLDNPQKIPKDSDFTIGSVDLFKKAVKIEPGISSKYLTSQDKIIGKKSNVLEFDQVVDWLGDKLKNSEVKTAVDSIAVELNKLSDQLEEIEKVDIEIKKSRK